jgi:methyltransferase (TIGR00027 family)
MPLDEAVAVPSRTSVLVAAARAFGSREPDEAVRNPDFLADCLLTASELALIEGHPLSEMAHISYAEGSQDPAMFMIVWLLLARTKFIDEKLRDAVADGATQVAIVGAGFDTRAYRFTELLRHCTVFEADAPRTQEYKKRRIRECIGEAPRNVTYCSLDLAAGDLIDTLETAGWSREAKTIFILEGVSMYLPEAVLSHTIKRIAACSARGSTLVLDYTNLRGIEAMEAMPTPATQMFANWGEPWIFGVPDENGEQYFRGFGLEPVGIRPVNDPEIIKRYTSRADGSIYGAALFQKMREGLAASPENSEIRKRAAAMPTYWLAEFAVV